MQSAHGLHIGPQKSRFRRERLLSKLLAQFDAEYSDERHGIFEGEDESWDVAFSSLL